MRRTYKSSPRARAAAKQQALQRKLAGLCVHGGCPDPPAPSATMCHSHLQQMRETSLVRHQERKRRGICRTCGRGPLASTVFCAEHLAKSRAYSAEHRKQSVARWCGCGQTHFRAEHKKLGFCSGNGLTCIETASSKAGLCSVHEAARLERVRAKTKAYLEARRKAGLCGYCGLEPVVTSRSRCAGCLEFARKDQAERSEVWSRANHELVVLVRSYRRQGGVVLVDPEVYERLAKLGLTSKTYKAYGTTVEIAPLIIEEEAS